MRFRIIAGTAATAVFVSLQMSAQAETTGTQATTALEGTRVVYETSGTVKIAGPQNQQEESALITTYTLLSVSPADRVVFAEVDQRNKKGIWEPASRFSFQIDNNGIVGENMAGYSNPPVDGWTPSIDLPPLAKETDKEITVLFPLNRQPIPASITQEKKGDHTSMTLSWKPTQPTPAPFQPQMLNCEYQFTPGELGATSSRCSVAAQVVQQMTLNFEATFQSRRKSVTKLQGAELDKFKKAVTDGLPVFEKLNSFRPDDAEATTQVMQLFSQYSAKHPDGPFTPVLSMIGKQLRMFVQLQENAANVAEGKKAPLFQAKTITGETVKLADLKGKVVLLDFWATWCPPCVEELPNIKKVYEKHKDNGFTIIGISADKELTDLEDFLAQEKLEWKQIFEPQPEEGTVQFLYGVRKYPTTVLIDREGAIRAVDLRGEGIAEGVEQLVTAK